MIEFKWLKGECEATYAKKIYHEKDHNVKKITFTNTSLIIYTFHVPITQDEKQMDEVVLLAFFPTTLVAIVLKPRSSLQQRVIYLILE